MQHRHKFPHLYVVTRRDLSPGYQAVQSIHAAQVFAMEHPTLFQQWYRDSNYLSFLSVPNEDSLKRLAKLAMERSLKVSMFFEPDVDFACTSIAVEPGPRADRLMRGLPLALAEYQQG